MNRFLILLALFAGMFAAAPAEAAYTFQPGPTYTWTERYNGNEVGTLSGPALYTTGWLGMVYGAPVGDVSQCEELAASQGLSETQDLWCVQESVPTTSYNNCVYTCQGGQGGNVGVGTGTNTGSTGWTKTFVYTSAPTITTVAWNTVTSGNDCGDSGFCFLWSTTYGVPAPTATLQAAPATIAPGGTSTLTAYCSNSTSASIDQGVGAVTLTTTTGSTQSGTKEVTPTTTTTYTLTCTGDGGTDTAEATVTVGNGPDLVGQLMNVISSALVGETKTFWPGSSNIGNVSTESSFTNLLQIDDDANHATVTASRTVTSPAVAAGGQYAGVSTTYSFGAAGTWYVRACADNNAAMVGTITETNESNNCTAWSPITVTTAADPSVMCTVSDTSVAVGEPVTYTATPSGGAGAPYSWTASDGQSGLGSASTASRTFTVDGSYGMRVSANGAASEAFCPNVIVGASTSCPGDPTPSVELSTTRVESGTDVTVTWGGTNVDGTCTLTTSSGYTQTRSAGGTCSVSSNQTTINVTDQTVVTVTCDEEVVTKVVNVVANIEEF